jgi:nucleoside-diphosphate-sugar epimerase
MKIAIIGTNGFLSTAIANYALNKGWQLDVYGLEKPKQHLYTNFYAIDLTTETIDGARLIENDIVVYAVGAGIQSNLKESAELIYKLNVQVPIGISKVLQVVDYKGVFITFGSYFELGETDIIKPATEENIVDASATAPTDYVISKRMLTQYILSYQHSFTHWHFILPTIYGVGENPKRLIPYTINAILNNEKLSYTSGEQIRQYLYVDDIPNCIDKAYSHQLMSGVYNIAGTIILSVRELVTIICNTMNYKLDTDVFGKESKSDTSMKYLALDGCLLEKTIDFKAETTIEKALIKYIE